MKKGIELYNELTLEEQEKFKAELLRKAVSEYYEGLYEFIFRNLDCSPNEGTKFWNDFIDEKRKGKLI